MTTICTQKNNCFQPWSFWAKIYLTLWICLGSLSKRSKYSDSQHDLGLKSESGESVYFIEELNQSYDLTFILAGSVYAIAALLVGIGAILQKRRLRKKSH